MYNLVHVSAWLIERSATQIVDSGVLLLVVVPQVRSCGFSLIIEWRKRWKIVCGETGRQ